MSSTSSKLSRSASWVESSTMPLLLLSKALGASDADGLGTGGGNRPGGGPAPPAARARLAATRLNAKRGGCMGNGSGVGTLQGGHEAPACQHPPGHTGQPG